MKTDVEQLASVLVDQPADSPDEVFRRCRAADSLSALGPSAGAAVPALLRTLIVRVNVDCGIALRVAAAVALWRVDRNWCLAAPFLTWALKDEYWGVAPRAVEVLGEIGHPAVVPDLIRLANRRLAHGPFHFEEFSGAVDKADSRSLLAAVAEAIGHCAQGPWDGPSYLSEARDVLMKLAAFDDDRVRKSASMAMAKLAGMHDQSHVLTSCKWEYKS